ncbi:MAG: molecular chaperone TorD family protein [Thermincola sp.]|jgi:nitrate reductase assembly molybdenum cofactor insertion protein NarJ|nr:molecular chaperone TorD family protein [Thermincola sp.]
MSHENISATQLNPVYQKHTALLGSMLSYPSQKLIDLVAQTSRELAEITSENETRHMLLNLANLAETVNLTQLEVEYNQIFVIKKPKLFSGRYWLVEAQAFRQEQLLADIAGIYRVWGLEISPEAHELPDHLVIMLHFLNYLFIKEEYAFNRELKEQFEITRESQQFFWQTYLAPWMNDVLEQLGNLVQEDYFRAAVAVATASAKKLGARLGGSTIDRKN